MFWDRKVWRSCFARPENQAEGMEPVASPVPGRMKPVSCLLSGVERGVAVYASTRMPSAEATCAT